MAKKERGKIGSKRTCTASTPYMKPKTPEAGPSHRQPAEPSPSGSGYELPNQSIYPNSPEPQSATGTDSFVENEPRPSGSGYGLPNQESYQDSPEPQSTIPTNSFVDNVSAEFYRSDGSINIQRMHGVRASLLESFTVPSRSPPAMTANIAVVIASARRRRSVEKSGDSESLKKGSGDTKSSPIFSQKKVNVKRMIGELENMSTPLSDACKFPFARKYRSTPLAQFMVEEDSVQQRNMGQPIKRQSGNPTIFSIFRKRNPTGQVSVCETMEEELVPALNPLPSSIVPSSSMTRGGDGNAREVEEEDSVQHRNMDKPVERQIDNNTSITNFEEGNASGQVSVCESSAEPVSVPNPPPSSTVAVSSQDNSESCSSPECSTRGKKRKKNVGFQCPAARGCDDDNDDDDDDDDEDGERVQLETNISVPVPKIPKVTSALVTSATTSSSDVFTFSPSIKSKIPVSIQRPSCSSREIIKLEPNLPKFTFSPATSVARPSTISLTSKPVTFDTSTSTDRFTRVTSNANTNPELFNFSNPITIKSSVLSQCSSLSTEEQIQPKFTFSPAESITRRPPVYSSSNISSTAVTSSAATPCSITVKTEILSKGSASNPKKRVQPETNISLPITKIPKVTSALVTLATTSSSDVFTFSPPIKIKIPVSIQSPSCSSREIIKLEPNLPKFTFSPATSVACPSTISFTSKPVTFDTNTSTDRFTRVTSNASTTPELFNFSNPIMIKSSVLSQCSSLSTEEQVQPKFTFSRATSITRHPPIYSSSNISSTTVTSPATTTCSITVKTGIFSRGSASQATFQPSCFFVPTTSTAPIPIKSWTGRFQRYSRNTFQNSPSTSSTPATHTPPESFRIGQWTNTLPAPSQNLFFSSTWQSSSFAMGRNSAGTSQQPSPFSAASNLNQQSSSPSTGFQSVLPSMNPFPF